MMCNKYSKHVIFAVSCSPPSGLKWLWIHSGRILEVPQGSAIPRWAGSTGGAGDPFFVGFLSPFLNLHTEMTWAGRFHPVCPQTRGQCAIISAGAVMSTGPAPWPCLRVLTRTSPLDGILLLLSWSPRLPPPGSTPPFWPRASVEASTHPGWWSLTMRVGDRTLPLDPQARVLHPVLSGTPLPHPAGPARPASSDA